MDYMNCIFKMSYKLYFLGSKILNVVFYIQLYCLQLYQSWKSNCRFGVCADLRQAEMCFFDNTISCANGVPRPIREAAALYSRPSVVFSAEMDIWSISNEDRTRVCGKWLRIHEFRSILTESRQKREWEGFFLFVSIDIDCGFGLIHDAVLFNRFMF